MASYTHPTSQSRDTKDEISAEILEDRLLQATTTHPLTIRALQTTKNRMRASVSSPH